MNESSARSDGTDADLSTEGEQSSARSDGTDADPRTEGEQSSARSDGTYADPRTEGEQSSARSDGTYADPRTEKEQQNQDSERSARAWPGSATAARERLKTVRGFVFDLDGTLVLGDRNGRGLTPLPGALEITRWAAGRRLPFVVLTNGTTKTPRELAQVLRGIGFDLADDAVMTPASSAVAVLTRRGQRRVMVLGREGLAGPLLDAGLDVMRPSDRAPRADAVLAGWYPEFTMADLEAACHAVWDGAALYSCSQSTFFATAQGRALGTSRAISAMITSLTGCRVRVVGKPSLDALAAAAARIGARPADLAVVGDDPELEVPMAHRGHALAIAVTSGLGSAAAFAGLPPPRRPHLRLRGVDELLSMCQDEG